VSYPALSFLTLVPFISLNIFNVLAFYLICYIVLIAIAWKVARPELRPWILLLSLANVSMWTSVVGGNLDVLNILLIVLAWLLRERGWWSALFLGLALASKQLSWFFVPFYAMMVWRQYNFTEAARRCAIAGGIALAINIPFILWNPHAWIAGVMAPMSDPMLGQCLSPWRISGVYAKNGQKLLCYWRSFHFSSRGAACRHTSTARPCRSSS
jgi:uncharacterized membrane protein